MQKIAVGLRRIGYRVAALSCRM